MIGTLAFGASALAQPPADAAVDEAPARSPEPAAEQAPEQPTAEDIARRLDGLEERHEARRYAGPAIDHGRLALRRAEELTRRGDLAGAERARQIAWAAYSLAARQLALAQERQALRAAARRLRHARERQRRAREALEQAMRHRTEQLAPEPEERMAPSEGADDQGETD